MNEEPFVNLYFVTQSHYEIIISRRHYGDKRVGDVIRPRYNVRNIMLEFQSRKQIKTLDNEF